MLNAWLQEIMLNEFIQQSSSTFVPPDLFAKKPDGSLLFCIHYRDINSKTIKNEHPLPVIKEMLNIPGKAVIYSKLDVQEVYNIL